MTMKYLNPITLEAEIFLSSLESLSKKYDNIDIALVSSLEKIMNAIENFLDSAPSEIIETKMTKLVKCDDISHINRIFTCSFCKRDIGKSIEKVALHLTEDCPVNGNAKRSSPEICDAEKPAPCNLRTKSIAITRTLKKDCNLSKKARSLLTTNLNQFIEQQAEISKKFKHIPAYDKIEKDLLQLATPLFPNNSVQVHKFGSRMAGVGHRDSDLDLYVDIGGNFNVFQNRADNKSVEKLKLVEKAIKSDSKSWNGLTAIAKARVPILKVIHTQTGIECDINFSNSLGVVNTKFLDYIFDLQPIAQSLCYYMKTWLNRVKMGGEINTYSLNLMIVFFLQTLGLIPSMERLQENIDEEKALKVGPWLCMYATYTLKHLNIPLIRVDQPNLSKYIRGFFDFYTNFNFKTNVICPYLGKVTKKVDIDNSMPSRYTEYKLEMDKPIIVQDPFQLNHNTTKNVDSTTLHNLKINMLDSLKILDDNFL